jgi:uracil-DNA glycosylase family 4
MHDSLRQVAADVRSCRRCPGMNAGGVTESAPGYGAERARVVIVGQSLCGPCMHTQIPFTGGSGRIVDKCLECAGLEKADVFTTNVVHCHPPDNRQSMPHEIANCVEYLKRELALLRDAILIIALGRDARETLGSQVGNLNWIQTTDQLARHTQNAFAARHPAYIMRQSSKVRNEYVTDLARMMRAAVQL